jgi:predicted NAD-dependent protein-ADP-ribosyltransferase YbiA (DUF1768 family)
MVVSKLNKKVNYKELKSVDSEDINKESDLFQIIVHKVDIVIALGNAKTTSFDDITFFPIYFVKSNNKVIQIGVYEVWTKDVDTYLDKDGVIDVELLGDPLIYIFISESFLEKERLIPDQSILEMETEKLRQMSEEKREKLMEKLEDTDSDLEEGEEYDEDAAEKRLFLKQKEKDELEKQLKKLPINISPARIDTFRIIPDALIMTSLTEETKHDALTITSQFESRSDHLWIQEFMKNLNYTIINNEGSGDCFFAVIRDAFEQIGQQTTVEQLRRKLATQITDKIFDNYYKLYNDAKESYVADKKKIGELAVEYKALQEASKQTLDKVKHAAIVKEANKIKREIDKLKIEAIKTKEEYIDREFAFMHNVNTLEELKAKILTQKYYADEMSISILERVLNIKFILLSNEAYRKHDLADVLNCGTTDEVLDNRGVFTPNFYIIMDFNGIHYQLITYKKKTVFEFKEVPYDIKKLIVHKCMERNSGPFSLIPEFIEFKQNIDSKIVNAPSVAKFEQAKTRDLYDDNIVFVFYDKAASGKMPGKGNGEKMPEGVGFVKDFAKLASISNWRKKLDNSWMQEFQLGGRRWASVDHYISACQFKENNPEFYISFSLESGTPLSKDLEIVKAALSPSGKNKGEIIRPKNVTADATFTEKRQQLELMNALFAKFSQNEDLKELLILTKNAALKHYKRSQEPELAENLIFVREKIQE